MPLPEMRDSWCSSSSSSYLSAGRRPKKVTKTMKEIPKTPRASLAIIPMLPSRAVHSTLNQASCAKEGDTLLHMPCPRHFARDHVRGTRGGKELLLSFRLPSFFPPGVVKGEDWKRVSRGSKESARFAGTVESKMAKTKRF